MLREQFIKRITYLLLHTGHDITAPMLLPLNKKDTYDTYLQNILHYAYYNSKLLLQFKYRLTHLQSFFCKN
jgi:hypothetical protein